jgi:hypothetical protein
MNPSVDEHKTKFTTEPPRTQREGFYLPDFPPKDYSLNQRHFNAEAQEAQRTTKAREAESIADEQDNFMRSLSRCIDTRAL